MIASLPLLAAVLLASARAFAVSGDAAPKITIEAPPGWTEVSIRARLPSAVLALKGPEASSFVLARAEGAPSDGAAAQLAYLTKLLDGIRAGSGADYRSAGALESRTFRNGVGVQLLRATLDGKPRLVVALVDAGGPPLAATLASAAPDAMLTPLFGALRTDAPEGAVRLAGVQRSLDDQLEVALGGGLRARAPTAEERGKGVVLALQGAGSEVVFLKLSEEDAAAKDQPGIVRATASDAAKVPLESVSPAKLAATPAGPSGVYAWARLPDSPDLRFACGFLPWQYWGYSLLARGPQADELLVGALAAVKAGPSAVPKLVAQTPALESAEPDGGLKRYLPVAAVLALVALLWRGGRKKGNLGS